MSEYEIDLARVKELKDKLYKIRRERLYTVDEVVKMIKKLLADLKKLNDEAKEAQEKLVNCESEDIRRWAAIIRAIESRKTILSAEKMALKEHRLLLTYLLKEEKRLEYLIRKLRAGVTD